MALHLLPTAPKVSIKCTSVSFVSGVGVSVTDADAVVVDSDVLLGAGYCVSDVVADVCVVSAAGAVQLTAKAAYLPSRLP